jgi:NADPH-dependent ferric siderophore reductase
VSTTRLTPNMRRIVLGGPDLSDLPVGDHTDAYVKLVYPPAGAPYSTAAEFTEQRAGLAAEHRPALRTYTIRSYDAAIPALTIDVVVHGDEGLAGPWAASAAVGDEIIILGPGGGYAPDPDADWHLMIGDESALPAIAAGLERLSPEAVAHVFIEVADATEEHDLSSPARLSVTWVHRHRDEHSRSETLIATVRQAQLPAGRPHAFLHGEAGFVKELRRHLRFGLGVDPDRLSASGYWRYGRTDEAWRAEKSAWKAEVEADEARSLP